MPKFRFVSLYAGAGGLDAGFLGAGMWPIWANDLDPAACETYRLNIGSHIQSGSIDEVLDESALRMKKPDLIIGGPPCQGFSVAGRMDNDDPRSRHVWRFIEIVGNVGPRAFVMENVPALARSPRWRNVRQGLVRLAQEAGYQTKLFVLNASEFGVPQARERMFLVGVRGFTPQTPIAELTFPPITVRQALAELPRYGEPGNSIFCTARITPARKPVLRQSPYAGMLFNGQGRPLDLDRPASTLPASMGGNRTPIIDQESLLDKNAENWVVGYHAHLLAGGRPRSRVPSRLRRITVEEAAALQSFPSSWSFSGPRSSQFRQIGNAVPPLLSYHVALAMKAALKREKLPGQGHMPSQLSLAA